MQILERLCEFTSRASRPTVLNFSYARSEILLERLDVAPACDECLIFGFFFLLKHFLIEAQSCVSDSAIY